MEKILYFPTINVPNNAWLRQSLLYWDGVSSIVPTDFWEEPEQLDEDMREMVRERIVQQMPIMPSIGNATRFEDGFIDFLKQHPRDPKVPRHAWYPVHVEKLGYGRLAETLLRTGIADEHDGSDFGKWLLVEPRTAKEFMAYLASCMAANSENNRRLIAMTDDPQNLQVFSEGQRRENELRLRAVEGLLPLPSADVDLRDLVAFRERHKKELVDLRREVDRRLKRSLVHDDEKGGRLFDFELEDLRERSERLAVEMSKPKWGPPQFGSLSGISALLGLVGAGVAVSSTMDGAAPEPAAAIGLAAAASAFAASCRRTSEPSPLAYASIAQSHFQS